MAIVRMKRFELFSFAQSSPHLLRALQEFQDVHFYDLRMEESDLPLTDSADMQELEQKEELLSNLRWMHRILSEYDERPTGLKAMKTGLDTLSLRELEAKAGEVDYLADFDALSDLQRRKEETAANISALKEKIRERTPWEPLHVSPEVLSPTASADVFLGTVPRKLMPGLMESLEDFSLSYIETVSEEGNYHYILGASHHDESETFRETLRRFAFSPVHLPEGGSVAELQQESRAKIEALEKEKEAIVEQMQPYAAKLPYYEAAIDYESNLQLKAQAAKLFLRTEKVDWIRGYIPAEKENALRALLDETLPEGYSLEIEEASAQDRQVPVELKNNRFVDSFASITRMYAMPRYNEIDPTPFLAPFYWVFFGMMGADVGYGAIVLVLTQLALRMFNLKPSMKKFVRFFSYLSVSMIIWGFLYGSFFGDLLPLPAVFDTQKDFIPMLVVSIGFGAVHLFFGLALKGYMHLRDGDWQGAIYDVLFWYMSLIGAILLLIGGILGLPALIATIAKWAMIAGMVGIVLFGGREAESIPGRLAMGMYSLYNISGYIGDFVSYSRLMALGLAGGFIGLAVNLIVGMLFGAGIIGYVVGIVVFIGFHLFNIFLSMLSAYVHTSRLTYVEFFGKFYEGGGIPFKPFVHEPKYSQYPENH